MKMKTYRIRKPKIVVIGGGTGLPVILKSLRNQSADITAVVTVADDGGSSGELRDSIDMAPPGDLRNVLAALSDMPKLYEDLFQYRFHESDKFLANHTIGNLLIAALSEMRNSTYEAIHLLSMMMHVDGHIYPSSEIPLVLHADFDDGTSAVGESKIAIDRKNIEKVYVTDKSGEKAVHAARKVVNAINEADMVVLGPGSLFTSILPSNFIDTVLVNTEHVPEGYMDPEIYDEYLVQVTHDFNGLREQGCRVVSTDFLKLRDGGVFHDGDKVVDELFRIVFGAKI